MWPIPSDTTGLVHEVLLWTIGTDCFYKCSSAKPPGLAQTQKMTYTFEKRDEKAMWAFQKVRVQEATQKQMQVGKSYSYYKSQPASVCNAFS